MILRNIYRSSKKNLSSARGFMFWYLASAIAALGVFYLIFFFFWSEIKSWFAAGVS